MEIPMIAYLVVSTIMFFAGVYGFVTRKNMLAMLISLELMLNAVNLLLVAFSKMHSASPAAKASLTFASDAQIFVFFIMIVAAAEVSVGLAIIVMMYRNTHSIDVNFLNRLKN